NPLISNPTHIAVLILARGGSKGIKLKNIAKVGGQTLLGISLREVNELKGIDAIWVSTDHEEIAEEATKGNANIHWRTPESASDTASSLEGIKEFLDHHSEVDVLALVQCTSPFVKHIYLQHALDHMKCGAECSFAVSRSHKLRWQELQNKLVPLNFDPNRRPRRQDFDGELVENGMFYFFIRKLIGRGVLQSSKLQLSLTGDNLEFEQKEQQQWL
ncbi:N-acylneuraminate cytidylyltransferase, partial [Gonioctena quinquepunctata]